MCALGRGGFHHSMLCRVSSTADRLETVKRTGEGGKEALGSAFALAASQRGRSKEALGFRPRVTVKKKALARLSPSRHSAVLARSRARLSAFGFALAFQRASHSLCQRGERFWIYKRERATSTSETSGHVFTLIGYWCD